MKISKTKMLVAGLLAGSLTFMGCKSDTSAERTDDTTQTGTGTDTGTGTTGEQGTGTTTPPDTGGSGTKQTDDNLRMPEEDPLRTPESESIRDAEAEPGVHDDGTLDPGPGVGGSGVDTGLDNDVPDDDLNEGGNISDDFRMPDSPADDLPESPMLN
jgi:hypothetical protein